MSDTKTKIDDGGPAFPHISEEIAVNVHKQYTSGGMSLRAYIATAAMQGLLAYPGPVRTGNPPLQGSPGLAIRGYEIADAMIAERNRK